jgi:hypothetical protein
MSPFIEVLFEVPKEIAKGLASGTMIRRGGVIQSTGGEVVAWLRESPEFARGASTLSAPVLGQLQSLQMATGVLAAGQVLTLGFAVVSFAVLNHKLNVLGSKMDGVLADLAQLKSDVAWLDRRQDIALAARLRGALDQGNWAYSTGRLEALASVRAVLVEVELHYAGLLEGMLEARNAHANAALFGTYQGYLALAAVARARCEVGLDGAAAGAPCLRSASKVLVAVDKSFREPLRNVAAHPELLRIGAERERALSVALPAMKETLRRMEGYETELNYCAQNRIPLADWEQLGGEDGTGRIALLRPKAL